MNGKVSILNAPPGVIILDDNILADIYKDMEADQSIMLEQSGIYE
uniref:Movement protein n=1 Tax=Geladintestivirus 4 TaxID=3233136 RepID=A0AAU8MGX6_9CAUD